MIELGEQQVIEELTDRLANVYAGVRVDQVSRIVGEQYARFDGRPRWPASFEWTRHRLP